MENQIKKQSLFHQTRMNEAKLGAYYTDPEHCKMISELLEFPEDEEVSCLEPSIGNAEAVVLVTKKRTNPKIYIFGVELNKETAIQVQENELVEDCIYGDFLHDAMISENAFSFCFANPPYGESDGARLEISFLRKIKSCLMTDAVLVYVIPHHVASEKQFLKLWNSNFHTECVYKFHEYEFKKWKQVVLIGRKRAELSMGDYSELENALSDVEMLQKVPVNYSGDKIVVYPSSNKGVATFRAKFFDAEKAERNLKKSVLNNFVQEKVKVQKFITDRLSRPPIMPNAGQMYLMAISGAGQGRVGTEEARDQHLQRGVVTNVEEKEYRQDEQGNTVEAVQRFTRINFNIIENNGMIHQL